MISLADQQTKLGRLLDERATHYRRAVAKDRLTLEVAAHKHAEVEAIRSTFRWFVVNADWIRAEAQRRKAHAAQMADISERPAVKALLNAFPDAEVTAVRPVAGGRLSERESPATTKEEPRS